MSNQPNNPSEENDEFVSEPQKKKRGRPKGSKNRPQEVAEFSPPCCQQCGSTTLFSSGAGVDPRKPIEGGEYFHGGKFFKKVSFVRMVCQECGQLNSFRKFEHEIVAKRTEAMWEQFQRTKQALIDRIKDIYRQKN